MKFEKVTYQQFEKDMERWYPRSKKIYNAVSIYNAIKLPERSTSGSAGYDIRTPTGVQIYPGEQVVIPTGIRTVFEPDEIDTWHLELFIRSSVGIKTGLVVTNGVSIIDADYQYAENGGDILIALKNTNEKIVSLSAGDRICQGIFKIHGLTSDDAAKAERTGGVGSTGKQ